MTYLIASCIDHATGRQDLGSCLYDDTSKERDAVCCCFCHTVLVGITIFALSAYVVASLVPESCSL